MRISDWSSDVCSSDLSVGIDATGTFKKRVIDGTLSLKSPALALTMEGGIDLGHNLFDDLRIEARLLRPAALIKSARGDRVALKLRFDGKFDSARFQY